ncbi:PRC-barrel domain-containing protein [Bacillus chungangensis]|uniref:Uncharacterized protein YrrD n=1 Tax=Bacillus chungangensis TaxID=587633 RepID=A0ABT9WMR0_9BACI|nr:PRC-barrel domain-containing protein [Bacillus chungangensis]MDQ0174257.1 uncharacterized protein YrrD [Bacillus chungangensis]
MRTYMNIKGLQVFDTNGKRLGTVCDVSISAQGMVTGLLVKTKGLLDKKIFVPTEKVLSYGDDTVMVKAMDSLPTYKKRPGEYTMTSFQPIARKNMLSFDGEQLGQLEDVYFLEEVGTIIGYELTDGFFSDITNGKRMIRTIHPPKIGEDAIVVSVNHMRGGVSHAEVPKLSK